MNRRRTFALILSVVLAAFLPWLIYSESITLTVTIGDGSTTTGTTTDPGPTPPPSGSGGGGGGGGSPGAPHTEVIFEGIAYPGSTVVLLRDGQVAARVPAGPDARFRISIAGLASGTYTFGTWAEDTQGVRSITHTFTETLTAGVTTDISGIFIPPTISIDKIAVRRGEPLTIIGQSAPTSQVTLFVHSETEITKNILSDPRGLWRYVLDTLPLENGDHTTQARAKRDMDISTLSQLLRFNVGNKTIAAGDKKKLIGDFNDDGKVNLVDFSILAYWYKRPLSGTGLRTDVNNDGKIDIKDFSIVAYYWTG